MANNCLVTTLKASVDDDNLEVLGKLRVIVTTDYENTDANTRLALYGGIKEYPAGITPPDADHVYYGDYTMFIANKYSITDIQCGLCVQLDTKEMSVLDISSSVTAPNMRGKFSDLAGLKCNTFSVAGMVRAFNIKEFLVVDTTYYVFINCPNATGDVASFGEKTNLTTLNISGSNGIGGDLFNLAKRQINAGRDECSGIAMPYLNTNASGLLFNGESVQNVRQSNNKLSWTYNSDTGIYTVSLIGAVTKTATYQKP